MTIEQEIAGMFARLGVRKAEPGQDVHKLLAVRIFGVAYEDVTPEQRRYAKMVNFARLYTERPSE